MYSSDVLPNGEEIVYSYDEIGDLTYKLGIDSKNKMIETYNFKNNELKRLQQ